MFTLSTSFHTVAYKFQKNKNVSVSALSFEPDKKKKVNVFLQFIFDTVFDFLSWGREKDVGCQWLLNCETLLFSSHFFKEMSQSLRKLNFFLFLHLKEAKKKNLKTILLFTYFLTAKTCVGMYLWYISCWFRYLWILNKNNSDIWSVCQQNNTQNLSNARLQLGL